MGSRQVQPPRESSSSPPEDEEPRDPEETAAAASAAPAASLPTLRLLTLEEPPPPPAAAGGPLVRARTDPFLPLPPRSRCACSLSPSPRPAALRQPAGPKALLLPAARAAREDDGAESRPAGAEEARPTLLAPPPGLAVDWTLQGNRLRLAPRPQAPGARAGRAGASCPGTRWARWVPGGAETQTRGAALTHCGRSKSCLKTP